MSVDARAVPIVLKAIRLAFVHVSRQKQTVTHKMCAVCGSANNFDVLSIRVNKFCTSN